LIKGPPPGDHRRMNIRSMVARAAYPLCLAAVIVLSLMPQPPRIDIDFDYLDKVEHALAYAALGFLGLAFFRDAGAREKLDFLLSVGFGFAVGVAIEFIQPVFGRNFELADMAVDLAGLLVGALALHAARAAAARGAAARRAASR
jgi:VanZ family protein